MQRFYVGWFHVGWEGIGDQSDAVTQNAWFRCALCAAISGEISILIQTGAESWGRFPVPRICRWESNIILLNIMSLNIGIIYIRMRFPVAEQQHDFWSAELSR